MEAAPGVEHVVEAIRSLYHDPDPKRKEEASKWLNQLQRSVYAWTISDQLLQRKVDVETSYFAAQTMRSKIQTSFHELPAEAHVSLRNSLMDHLTTLTPATSQVIVTQLCLAMADLIILMPEWPDALAELMAKLSVGALLEVLLLLPEAATSVRELLDSLEARVEGVRRAAAALQGEQEELLSSLRAVGAGVGELGEVEREEVGLEVERLVSRVEAVQVRVATVRTAGQQEAVEKVEMEVRGLVARLQGGGEVELLVRECRGMLAACGGEEGGVRSEGFERLVLGCSASDQKLVRRRLEVLLEQMVALQGV